MVSVRALRLPTMTATAGRVKCQCKRTWFTSHIRNGLGQLRIAGTTSQGGELPGDPLGHLHAAKRAASSCARRGGHVQLCSIARGARGINPETFRRRGQLLSRAATGQTGIGRSSATADLTLLGHRLWDRRDASPRKPPKLDRLLCDEAVQIERAIAWLTFHACSAHPAGGEESWADMRVHGCQHN